MLDISSGRTGAGDLIVAGMMIAAAVFALLFTRNRRDLIRGLSYKQFVWCCIIGIVSAAFIIIGHFLF